MYLVNKSFLPDTQNLHNQANHTIALKSKIFFHSVPHGHKRAECCLIK